MRESKFSILNLKKHKYFKPIAMGYGGVFLVYILITIITSYVIKKDANEFYKTFNAFSNVLFTLVLGATIILADVVIIYAIKNYLRDKNLKDFICCNLIAIFTILMTLYFMCSLINIIAKSGVLYKIMYILNNGINGMGFVAIIAMIVLVKNDKKNVNIDDKDE